MLKVIWGVGLFRGLIGGQVSGILDGVMCSGFEEVSSESFSLICD